jgi:hypothetical protein
MCHCSLAEARSSLIQTVLLFLFSLLQLQQVLEHLRPQEVYDHLWPPTQKPGTPVGKAAGGGKREHQWQKREAEGEVKELQETSSRQAFGTKVSS